MLTLATYLLTKPQSFHAPQSSLLFPWLPPTEPCHLKQQHISFSSLISNTIPYCSIGNLHRKTHGTYICLTSLQNSILTQVRPCSLTHRSEATWLLGLWVRIQLRAWMFICFVCCVLCRQQPLQWTDHLFRGALPGMCDFNNEMAYARDALLCHNKIVQCELH